MSRVGSRGLPKGRRVPGWSPHGIVEPREQARYSNTGYILLGALIERVTGQPYGEAMRTLVLEPAGMRGTGVAYPPGAEEEGRLVVGTHPRFDIMAALLPSTWARRGKRYDLPTRKAAGRGGGGGPWQHERAAAEPARGVWREGLPLQ